jgi:hypothetical protein
MNIYIPENGLIVLLIAVSENPPAWDVVGPLTDHVAAAEVAEEHEVL